MRTIVHVVEATATGTLSMICIAANLLAERGFQVHVIYSLRLETPTNLQGLFRDSVRLHNIQMSGRSALASVRDLRRKLQHIKPEVIHLHSSIAGFIGRIATIGIHWPAKIFYSPHCISMMRKDIRKRAFLFALLERIATLKQATYLACSHSEQEAIRRWVGVDAKVLENAINPDDLSAYVSVHTCTSPPKPRIVVTVGGIRPQKNPALFASISRLCARRGLNTRFLWVGDGDPALAAMLREAGVDVTGWKAKHEVYPLLATSDIYLSTASWEGQPVSIIEAMACGKLVLATPCSGNVDVVTHGHNGLLFDSANDAANLIKNLEWDANDVRQMTGNAKEEANTRFSVSRFSEQLLTVYGDMSPSPSDEVKSNDR